MIKTEYFQKIFRTKKYVPNRTNVNEFPEQQNTRLRKGFRNVLIFLLFSVLFCYQTLAQKVDEEYNKIVTFVNTLKIFSALIWKQHLPL